MAKIGYVYAGADKGYLDRQLEGLKKYGVDSIVQGGIRNPKYIHEELDELLESLTEGDQLVVYHLVSVGKSIIQLAEMLAEFEERGIDFLVIKKAPELVTLDDETYKAMIHRLAKMEKMIIRERTARGLEEARKNGRIGGRPRISQETVDKIQFLYHKNKYTLRQIAEECNISLGTAYKYTQEKS
ncbi:recombinase family protein [Vagococcus lutrae]|uniref:Recombinase family protein n=1 Tax=Vagococcus lutrae TaxID=81947 RepID=A0AAE9XM21_9ENTE|nr:recombinase family protein [Vagococcus lutrae]MDO5742723.1 recombinase family protein [Vagococcus sp.]MCO7150778.1 recombinase family protein [Vagococcus lutrae]MDT2801639.1 recombinase family protein [Vagococcus lutrae]MDT2808573.1 recombinase family protein [Vagococcus lutrae]MDT2812033.1 recombinase family protein [Vagococcus lutrae]